MRIPKILQHAALGMLTGFIFRVDAAQLSQADSLVIQIRHQLQEAANKWEEPLLLQARAGFERLLNIHPETWLIHYYIALSDFYLTNFYFGKENKDQAGKMIEDGINHLNTSLEKKKDFADAYALLANFYGQKISLSPLKAMYLGPRAGFALQKARELEPDNPRVHLISGISAFFTPKMFGGGKNKARQRLKKAAELYKTYQPPRPIYPQWGHDQSYAWLGIVAIDQDSLDLAESYFHKALEINPAFSWVKYRLLKELEEERQKITSDSDQ